MESRVYTRFLYGVSKIRGTFFGCSHDKDYSILGYWGPLILGHYSFLLKTAATPSPVKPEPIITTSKLARCDMDCSKGTRSFRDWVVLTRHRMHSGRV